MEIKNRLSVASSFYR